MDVAAFNCGSVRVTENQQSMHDAFKTIEDSTQREKEGPVDVAVFNCGSVRAKEN